MHSGMRAGSGFLHRKARVLAQRHEGWEARAASLRRQISRRHASARSCHLRGCKHAKPERRKAAANGSTTTRAARAAGALQARAPLSPSIGSEARAPQRRARAQCLRCSPSAEPPQSTCRGHAGPACPRGSPACTRLCSCVGSRSAAQCRSYGPTAGSAYACDSLYLVLVPALQRLRCRPVGAPPMTPPRRRHAGAR